MSTFIRPVRHRPEDSLKRYFVYRKQSKINESGRPVECYDLSDPVLCFYGSISRAKQTEKVEYRQMGHNVTHEVIAFERLPVRAGDLLVLGNRKFYIHDIRDPGELGLVFCMMTEEGDSFGRMENEKLKCGCSGRDTEGTD